MIIVDASVLAPALADDGHDGDSARDRLKGERLCAPALVDIEVASVLQRAAAATQLNQRRSAQALCDLALLPLRRVDHLPLLDRIWELRDNVTVYDGANVALAELASAPLVTADARLSRVPGIQLRHRDPLVKAAAERACRPPTARRPRWVWVPESQARSGRRVMNVAVR